MRKWLIGLGAVATLLGGVTYVYGQQLGMLAMLLMTHQPRQSFAEQAPPSAPDYADPAAWAALPEKADDPTDVAPEGYAPVDPAMAEVDVFFIHPTSFFSNDRWNQSLDDAKTNERTDNGSLRNQASVFNGCCRVYAPRYRQMTFSGFLESNANTNAALDLAYSDVKHAFEYYLAHYNNGRPFIIASHSQGSRHARVLVQEMIDGTPLARRMVAAYIVGSWIDQNWFDEDLKTVKPCEATTDTGCVITWSTMLEGSDLQKQRDSFAKRSGLPEAYAQRKFVCTNPLIWSRSEALAPAEDDLGGWASRGGDPLRKPDPNLVSARCENGALVVSDPGDAYHKGVLPFGNYHNYDYQLAYMNIRKNAEDRATAFVAKEKGQ